MARTVSIESIVEAIKKTAPDSVKSVTWKFPGYISIMFNNNDEISFGEHLDQEDGYSWQADNDGGCFTLGEFDNLPTAKEVADQLWIQFNSYVANCNICKTTENLLTDAEKDNLRADWAGVDFYSQICHPCWTVEMATI